MTYFSFPDELSWVAERVGVAAAEYVNELRPSGRVDVAYTKSSSTDAVTELDRASEEFIRERLLAERPNDTIIGEEGEDHAGTSDVSWLVDPIDGTVNFIYGIPAYAVSLAAQIDGDVVAGCVVNIVTGESRASFVDGGIRGANVQNPQSFHDVTALIDGGLAQALVATGFNYLPEVRAKQGLAVAQMLPQVRDIRRFGSAALDLCALASGQVDAYVEQGLQPWDMAAGVLIAREAGIVVAGLNADGSRGEPSERLVMAAHEVIAEEFFDLVVACGF